jgi:hypothetical protein
MGVSTALSHSNIVPVPSYPWDNITHHTHVHKECHSTVQHTYIHVHRGYYKSNMQHRHIFINNKHIPLVHNSIIRYHIHQEPTTSHPTTMRTYTTTLFYVCYLLMYHQGKHNNNPDGPLLHNIMYYETCRIQDVQFHTTLLTISAWLFAGASISIKADWQTDSS